MLEIENRTREIFRFTKASISSDGAIDIDHTQDLVLGSKKDADLPAGITHGPLCPAPVVRLSSEQLESYGERNLGVIRALEKAEKIRIRKVS